MGISISVFEGAVPRFPLEIKATFECDAASEMFCRGFQTIQHSDGFIGCHRAAMNAGWLERDGSQGRVWLCPECSGKRRIA